MNSVAVIDKEALSTLLANHEEAVDLVRTLAAENSGLKRKTYLTVHEVSEMTGFGEKWIRAKKDEIGFYDKGGLRFHRKDVENWLQKYYIKPKERK